VFAGDRLPGSQKHAGAAAVNYERPLSNGMDFTANYAAIYTGDILSKIGKRGFGEKIPDYWISKASVGVSKDNWQASLFADNLFDKYAVISVSNDTSDIGSISGVTKRYYAYGVLRPRVIGLDLRYKY
jgi:iron complex outermembrane receptor protein